MGTKGDTYSEPSTSSPAFRFRSANKRAFRASDKSANVVDMVVTSKRTLVNLGTMAKHSWKGERVMTKPSFDLPDLRRLLTTFAVLSLQLESTTVHIHLFRLITTALE